MIQKFYLLGIFLLTACGQIEHTQSAKPKVIVSLSPYDGWIQTIAKDVLDVEALIPSNFSCEEFSPTLKEVSLLFKGDIWFCLGESFETGLCKILKEKKAKIEIVSIASEAQEHAWLCPKKALNQLELITKILKKRYPQFSQNFENNFSTLQKEFLALEEELSTKLSKFQGKAILVSHPLLTTFCKEYGLKQIALEKDEFSFSLEKLFALHNSLPIDEICVACILPQTDNRSLELFAKKRKIPSVIFDPFSKNYFENLKTLCNQIEKNSDERR